MVKIIHKGKNVVKIDSILETAQKRFGLYGFEKVSMKEIASDLNMAKGSLYYYFPDKEHLYRAVIQKEFDEFTESITQKINELDDPEVMLHEFVNIRFLYFKKFMNLSRFRLGSLPEIQSVLADFWVQSQNKETAIIKTILQKGIKNGIFHIDNPSETATLFLDVLKGLRIMLMRRKQLFYLEEEEYNVLIEKANKFTLLFIRGIK